MRKELITGTKEDVPPKLQALFDKYPDWDFDLRGLAFSTCIGFVLWFKTPKTTEYHCIREEFLNKNIDELTEEDLHKEHINAVVKEKDENLQKFLNEVRADLIDKYRAHLEQKREVPDVVDVRFEVNFVDIN